MADERPNNETDLEPFTNYSASQGKVGLQTDKLTRRRFQVRRQSQLQQLLHHTVSLK